MRASPRICRNTSFVQKLLMLLQDQQCLPYIHWIDTHNGFNIVNVSGFTQNVLPVYFKHQNYSSFVRQLNMYGFNKIRGKQGDNIYQHKNFKRGSKACLKKIQRKIPSTQNQKNNQIVLYNPQNTICEIKKKQTEIQKLKERQVDLELKCLDLIQKNKQLLEKNQEIISQIRYEQQKKKRLIEQIFSILNSSTNQFKQRLPIQGIKETDMQKQNYASIEENEHQNQNNHFSFKQKQQINIFDQNQKEYFNLDDFININEDDLIDGFGV